MRGDAVLNSLECKPSQPTPTLSLPMALLTL